MKLIEFIKNEANLVGDIGKSTKINNYINYAQQQINSYTRDNHVIKLFTRGSYDYVSVKVKDLTIIFTNTNGKRPGDLAGYDKDKNIIYVYKCSIRVKPKLEVGFNPTHLSHELTHYFDMKNLDTSKIKSLDSSKTDIKNYYNDPFETNAHFFQYVVPKVLEYIEDKNKLPKTFNEFRNILTSDKQTNGLFSNLNDENKRKFLKRIGEYWTSILNNDKLDLENPDSTVNNSELEKQTYSWIDRIKDRMVAETQLTEILREVIFSNLNPKYGS